MSEATESRSGLGCRPKPDFRRLLRPPSFRFRKDWGRETLRPPRHGPENRSRPTGTNLGATATPVRARSRTRQFATCTRRRAPKHWITSNTSAIPANRPPRAAFTRPATSASFGQCDVLRARLAQKRPALQYLLEAPPAAATLRRLDLPLSWLNPSDHPPREGESRQNAAWPRPRSNRASSSTVCPLRKINHLDDQQAPASGPPGHVPGSSRRNRRPTGRRYPALSITTSSRKYNRARNILAAPPSMRLVIDTFEFGIEIYAARH